VFNPRLASMAFGITSEEAAARHGGGRCVRCDGPATEFSDEASRLEHGLSGLCQPCQDVFFGGPDDD